MTITKRHFLVTGAAALGAAALPRRVWSQTTLSLGTMEVTTLSDGNLTLPADFIFAPMPQDELLPLLAEFGIARDAPLTPPCNVTLVRHEDRVILFDAGAGFAFQDSAGALLDAMAGAGIDPMDVTHVVFTHGHPDHLWGVLDDFDEPTFLNAEHLMGGVEFDYWFDPATVDTIGEARASFAVGAKRRLDIVADQIQRFGDGEEILPGIAARMTPGHTPGHMAFEIGGGSDSAMILGDAVTNPHVGFARPAWPSGSDQDETLGAETRASLLGQAASGQMRVIGFHLPEGGIGRVEPVGEGYRFVPDGA